MRILVDGVFFQLSDIRRVGPWRANGGIARVWVKVLEGLAALPEHSVYLLDRGGAPTIAGVRNIPFPAYLGQDVPADSMLIQKVCDHFAADVFSSTYYTTPLATPMALVVYDMIPELFGFDMSSRIWMEKTAAISFALRYLCISNNTKRDLLALYPEIDPAAAHVAHCGVDTAIFRPREAQEVAAFRSRHGLDRPYFLFVGDREQHKGYKNGEYFFRSLGRLDARDFDVLCVGGAEQIEPAIRALSPAEIKLVRADLADDELALAYSGARALVYPSLYEGFGMPVIEAMACACPVITTAYGSLAEAAGDVAVTVDGQDPWQMADAIRSLADPETRARRGEAGRLWANRFSWSDFVAAFGRCLDEAVAIGASGAADGFFAEWARVRRIQADVDYG